MAKKTTAKNLKDGPADVTRYISLPVQNRLWGRAAGRCQFMGCNVALYKSSVTQEDVNIAEKAHIYSFAKSGPRGRGPYSSKPADVNNIENLLLFCHGCHEKIDQDVKGDRYGAELLKLWKEQHECRVELVTGIIEEKKSHVVLYGSRIGDERTPLRAREAMRAMFGDWWPAEERPINLSMQSTSDDGSREFWDFESSHLKKVFERDVRPRIDEGKPNHFSVFGLASQPLLILLGALFTDKTQVEVYQLHREPVSWAWQKGPADFEFQVVRPASTLGKPVLKIALSAQIVNERIHSVIPGELSIWTITIEQPHNDFLQSKEQLSKFRKAIRLLVNEVNTAHHGDERIAIFPAMPVACAIELGRCRQPKADKPWEIFDQNHKHSKFITTLNIG